MYDTSENYQSRFRKGIALVILIAIFFLIVMFAVVVPVEAAQTYNSSVNLTGATHTTLTFSVIYKGVVRATAATFDGVIIEGFDVLHDTNYTASNLEPNTTHQFCIYKDLYNCAIGTTIPEHTEGADFFNNINFYAILILCILCIIAAAVFSRIIGFVALIFALIITMLSFQYEGFTLLIGVFLSIASITAIFWGKGD